MCVPCNHAGDRLRPACTWFSRLNRDAFAAEQRIRVWRRGTAGSGTSTVEGAEPGYTLLCADRPRSQTSTLQREACGMYLSLPLTKRLVQSPEGLIPRGFDFVQQRILVLLAQQGVLPIRVGKGVSVAPRAAGKAGTYGERIISEWSSANNETCRSRKSGLPALYELAIPGHCKLCVSRRRRTKPVSLNRRQVRPHLLADRTRHRANRGMRRSRWPNCPRNVGDRPQCPA